MIAAAKADGRIPEDSFIAAPAEALTPVAADAAVPAAGAEPDATDAAEPAPAPEPAAPDHYIRLQSLRTRAEADAALADWRATFPEAEIRVERLWDYPGLGTPTDADVVNFVKSLTGANGTIKVAFGTEGGLFSQRLGIPTVICGPGSMAQGHKPDEFVTIEQMDRCNAMLDALIDRLEGQDALAVPG